MVDRKPYLVFLPGRNERGFGDFSKKEITFANNPYRATKNVLFRKAEVGVPEKQRRARVLRLADDMDCCGQNLEKYAYEIETKFYDESGSEVKLSRTQYRIAQEFCLAEEMSSRKGFPNRTEDYLDCARKNIDFYYEQLIKLRSKR